MRTGQNYHGQDVTHDGSSWYYLLANGFAYDHWARDCGEGDIVEPALHAKGVHAHRVGVYLDAAGYDDMLSDAQHYASMREELTGDDKKLADSAARVVKVLLKRGRPKA